MPCLNASRNFQTKGKTNSKEEFQEQKYDDRTLIVIFELMLCYVFLWFIFILIYDDAQNVDLGMSFILIYSLTIISLKF